MKERENESVWVYPILCVREGVSSRRILPEGKNSCCRCCILHYSISATDDAYMTCLVQMLDSRLLWDMCVPRRAKRP
jgi:hypothetical protein